MTDTNTNTSANANAVRKRRRFGSSTRLSGWVVALLTLATLPGCALGRWFEAKQQFCDFDANFSYSLEDHPEFVFARPVILDADVRRLVGSDPSRIIPVENGLIHRYVVEKVSLDDVRVASPGDAFVFDLHYQVDEGQARLRSVHLPAEFGAYNELELQPDPQAIAVAADRICSASLGDALRSAEEDIDPRHLQNLPDRAQLLTLMGAPSWHSPEEAAMIYEYRIQGDTTREAAMRVVLWFGEEGEKPVRMETRYRQMRSLADFERGKARFSYRG